MARKRKGLPVNGWVAVDKPVGIGSTQVVAAVRWLFQAAKAGHGGTLDPLASGVLPVALGEATKTVSYAMDGAKTYRWQVRWGEARSTDDLEGAITATSPVRPETAAIEAALAGFTGDILQVPPAYSAIKIDGERAYDLARSGEAVALAARSVRIDAFRLVGQPDADHADFETVCGKGTYIRALSRDLAARLGTLGHVTVLRRTRCGPFGEEGAISLDNLRALGQGPALRTFLLPIETVLDDIPALALDEAEVRRFRTGQAIPLRGGACALAGPVVRAMSGSCLVALARIEGGMVHPVRVLNSNPVEGDPDVDHGRA